MPVNGPGLRKETRHDPGFYRLSARALSSRPYANPLPGSSIQHTQSRNGVRYNSHCAPPNSATPDGMSRRAALRGHEPRLISGLHAPTPTAIPIAPLQLKAIWETCETPLLMMRLD
jgi:hypothetical protein